MKLFRTIAILAALAGGAGSVALTLQAGRGNHSLLLKTMFTIWVASPFAALVGASLISACRKMPAPVALYTLMALLAPVSLALYESGLFHPPAAVFLMVPLASWAPIAILLAAGRRSRS